MPAFPPVDEQLAVILRGAAHVEVQAELRKKLDRSRETGTALRIKYGIDPTGFDVHLGHTVPLRKLRQFQELGHTAVLIIGTATAAVGDPSGRDKSREGLTTEQIERNAATYLTQIAKVVDVTRAEVRPNGEWFNRFGFADMLKLLGHMTMQRMLERDDFSKRVTAGTPIYLHECLYPLMQGHDSVEIRADVELGGTEQLFNLMVGRDLQRAAGQEPQICLTLPILKGTDGEKKMGKTAGNYIGLNEPARDQFGKTMRIPDELMREWFTLLSDRTPGEIEQILLGKPNEAKKSLGAEIVRFYHGAAGADEVLAEWKKQFEDKGDPEHITEVPIPATDVVGGEIAAIKLIVLAKLAESNGEARRKIQEGAFNYGPERIKPADAKANVQVSDGLVVRLGRKIARVRLG
jgi:tyrosyl-tRNA synthetase